MQIIDDSLRIFLDETLESSEYKVFPLAGDASNRRYFRVILDHHSWVVMKWEPFDPDRYPFLSVQSHFKKNGVSVPEVVKQAPQQGLLLLEDLGDLTLERRFWENQNPENSILFYKMAVDELIKIHGASTEDKSPCVAFNIQFDVEKLLWELNYGKDNLLTGVLKYSMSEKVRQELQKIFIDICEKLHQEPKRIAHRDYHSRNLMIKLENMKVIDFQDARMGPVQYDLVSLFKDSYVNLSEAVITTLMNDYIDKAQSFLPKNFSKHHFDYIYEVQSIQRCFKACGSFASFFHQREDRRYLKYLPTTLERVLKSLTLFPEYQTFSNVLIDSGAMEKKYDQL